MSNDPRLCLVEMGHSRLKWAWLAADGTLSEPGLAGRDDPDALVARLGAGTVAEVWLVAVPGDEVVAGLTGSLERAGLAWRRVTTGSLDLPVAPAYPGLGVDRWLAMQPVWQELRSAFCVADCGTALTFDIVDAGGRHRGGWILPGLAAARAGLLERAPGLRRRDTGIGDAAEPAVDTAGALGRGLVLQLAGGLEACHRAARAALGRELPLILTGGDAGRLQSLLAADRVDEHLVLRGLALATSRVE